LEDERNEGTEFGVQSTNQVSVAEDEQQGKTP